MTERREGGFLISKIHHLAGRIFTRLLKEHELDEINPAQGRILFVLWQEDCLQISELARKTALGKSTLTSMLDRLETRGYIRRVPSAEDRRIVLIQRTEKDRRLQELYDGISEEMTALFYSGFVSEEVDAFEGYLQRILANLNEKK